MVIPLVMGTYALDNDLPSLDGGGVRGLSTLYILKGLMTRLNGQRQDAGLPPMKPYVVRIKQRVYRLDDPPRLVLESVLGS
jgi:hypothetical protein